MESRNVSFQLDRQTPVNRNNHSTFRPQQQQQRHFDSFQSQKEQQRMPNVKPRNMERSQTWRARGKVYRAQIVLEDEQKGGNAFVLSNQCSIDRYYRVAEKVLDQFLSTSGASSSPEEVSESYLVGNRLVKFLSVVLPTHKEYFSNDPELIQCRVRSQEQLIDLLQYMEELALIVDEIQYNLYILQDLKPAKKSNSGDWTESTANDTSMESMASEMSTQNHFEQRIAAVVSASETKPSKLAKPEPKTFTPSKRPQQNFQDMSFEDDLFGGSDDFDDDFDIRSNDFSFQADFSSFGNNNDDYWFSKAQGSQHRADWFAESQNTSYNSHNTSFTTPTSNRYTTTAQSAPGRSNGFNTTPTRIPKMKPPRSAPPRELMQQSFPTEFDVPPPSTTTNTPASPNRKASLLDDDTLPAPKSKIEERLEQAERMQKDFNNMESVNRRQPREEALTVTTNKRLLHHFKGCVRFLGD